MPSLFNNEDNDKLKRKKLLKELLQAQENETRCNDNFYKQEKEKLIEGVKTELREKLKELCRIKEKLVQLKMQLENISRTVQISNTSIFSSDEFSKLQKQLQERNQQVSKVIEYQIVEKQEQLDNLLAVATVIPSAQEKITLIQEEIKALREELTKVEKTEHQAQILQPTYGIAGSSRTN